MSRIFGGKDDDEKKREREEEEKKKRREHEHEPGKHPEQQPGQQPGGQQPGKTPGQQPVRPNQDLGQPPGRREDEQQPEEKETRTLKQRAEGFEKVLRRGERTTTTPDSETGEEAETKPVGEFDTMSSTERLDYLRGWGQRNRLGGPMSAGWEEFDAALGEPPESEATRERGQARAKQAENARKKGDRDEPFDSEQRLA